MSRLLALSLAAVLTGIGTAWAQVLRNLPPDVQRELDEEERACALQNKKPLVVPQGFIRRKDVNGDRVIDYIVDFTRVGCGEPSSDYCGTGGCVLMVFASRPDGRYQNVFTNNVWRVRFRTINRRPAMVVDMHHSHCDNPIGKHCRLTGLWNGTTFARSD
jgi:hypothetical protein